MWTLGKQLIFGSGRRPHRVWFGIGAGCRLLIDPAGKSQRILGLDEQEIGKAFRAGALVSRTLIDVGASDGYYAIAAMRLNPLITAVACEPDYESKNLALANYQLNFPSGGPVLEWIQAPIGTAPSHRPLDSLIDGKNGPFLLKVDVDGYEVDVLRSGPRLLSETDCMAIVEVHSPQLEAETLALLNSYRFNARIVDNAWWRTIVPERRPIALNRWIVARRSPDRP